MGEIFRVYKGGGSKFIEAGDKVFVKSIKRVGVLKNLLVVEIGGEDKILKYEDIRSRPPKYKFYIYGVWDSTGIINAIVCAESEKAAIEYTREYVKKEEEDNSDNYSNCSIDEDENSSDDLLEVEDLPISDSFEDEKEESNIVLKVEKLGIAKGFTYGQVISYDNDYLVKCNHDLNNKKFKVYSFDLHNRNCVIVCASSLEEAQNLAQEYVENNNKFSWTKNRNKFLNFSEEKSKIIGTTNKFSKAQVMVCKDAFPCYTGRW